jgi:hypothetical protein
MRRAKRAQQHRLEDHLASTSALANVYELPNSASLFKGPGPLALSSVPRLPARARIPTDAVATCWDPRVSRNTILRPPREESPRPLRTRARARRRRGRTLTEKEGAVVGAEAEERASVGMASSGASAESARVRGKRQAGRGGDGRSRRRRGGRRGQGRRSRRQNARMADARVSAWTAGAPQSACTGSVGLGARTAGTPPSASTTE